jgi:DNA repair exonuclease SbcCD ATPase subunit
VRISAQQRHDTQTRIRAAIDRLLRGDIPPGGKCDVTTLAQQAGVDRTAFYGTKPYAHLREEFEQRLQAHRRAGEHPDPREAQITRLKDEIDQLKQRNTRADQTITELAQFKAQALSRLAAQHEDITRLRAALERANNVRRLPTARSIDPRS